MHQSVLKLQLFSTESISKHSVLVEVIANDFLLGESLCLLFRVRNFDCTVCLFVKTNGPDYRRVKRNTRSAPLAVRTSDRGSDQSQLLAICALTDLTKEALPSSFLIEAF